MSNIIHFIIEYFYRLFRLHDIFNYPLSQPTLTEHIKLGTKDKLINKILTQGSWSRFI